jgi:hypothetical protein
MRRLIDRLRRRKAVDRGTRREVTDEERDALTVEREQRDRNRKQGEAYIRSYAEPAANWRRPTDTPPDDS